MTAAPVPAPGSLKRFGAAMLLMMLATTSILAADRPNILMIVSEDNGQELGCYGERTGTGNAQVNSKPLGKKLLT